MTATTASAIPTESASRAVDVRRPGIPSLALMFILLVVVFAPIFVKVVIAHTDYAEHVRFAYDLQRTGDFSAIPHPVYHGLVLAFSALIPNVEPLFYGWLAVFLPYILMGMILFVVLHRMIATRTASRAWLTMPLVLMLLAVTPIFILMPHGCPECLLGYANPTIYHNPTFNVLKLWLIPVSLLALRAVRAPEDSHRWQRIGVIALAALLVILMTFTKPNYTICLLPGLGLFVLYRLATRKRVDWPLLIFGFGLPGAGVLGAQYLLTYSAGTGSSLALGFFTVYQDMGIPVGEMPIRLILSAAFPLAVYLLYFDAARRDTYLNLSWLILFIGLFYAYFVYEAGPRQGHGNFLWGSYAAVFVMMFASVAFLIRQAKAERAARPDSPKIPRRLFFAALIFELQVLFGVAYWVGLQILL